MLIHNNNNEILIKFKSPNQHKNEALYAVQDSERSCIHVETLQVRNSYLYYHNTNGTECVCVCVCVCVVFFFFCFFLLFLFSLIMLTDEAAA